MDTDENEKTFGGHEMHSSASYFFSGCVCIGALSLTPALSRWEREQQSHGSMFSDTRAAKSVTAVVFGLVFSGGSCTRLA